MLTTNLALYVLSHHFEGLMNVHPMKNPRNSVVLAFIILSSTSYIFHIADFIQFADMTLNYAFTTAFAVAFCLAAARIAYISVRRFGKTSSVLELVALLLNLVGCLFYHFFFAGIYYFGDQRASSDLVLSLGNVLSITGLVVYLVDFLIFHHLYRLPNPVYYVMMYSDVGIPLYIRKISQIRSPTLNDLELLPALFSAIDAFIRETLGTRESLNYIDGDAFQILFSPFPNDHVIFALITTHGSYYLEKSVQEFMNQFPVKMLDNVNIHAVGQNFNTTVDSLLKTHLPFLDIEPDQPHE